MRPDLFSLRGQRAFVTGASGGLGVHFARVLHAAGAHVTLAARRVEACAALAAELGEGRAEACALDVTDAASVAAALDRRAVDILVNNAGIAATGAFLDHSAAEWDRVLATDLRGCFLVGQAAARGMRGRGAGGVIVNVASILADRVIAGVASYAAAKAGLVQLTRAMAVELARFGIRVNALAPGYIASDINRKFFDSEAGQALVRRIPQRRLGTPDDLTGPLLLLCGPAGAHLTGSVLTVDGGHSISPL